MTVNPTRGTPGVALVTGGSRGIGRAVSERFIAAGWKVAVNFHSDAESAEAVVASADGRAKAYQCDVTDEAGVLGMVDAIGRDLGPVDVLVNNAGLWRGGLVHRVDLKDFQRVIEVALVGTRNCSVAVLPHMRESGSGHIVNVSSAVAMVGWAGDSAYAAAKAGVIGLTRALAKELAVHGVRVNAVVPGFIDTDMTESVSAEQRRQLLGRTLLQRRGEPADVAGVVCALVSEGAFMTGSCVVVDGGFVLGRDVLSDHAEV